MRRDWHISDSTRFLSRVVVAHHVTHTTIHTTDRSCGPDRSKFGEPIIYRERRHSIRNPQVLFLLSTLTWIHSQLSSAQPAGTNFNASHHAAAAQRPPVARHIILLPRDIIVVETTLVLIFLIVFIVLTITIIHTCTHHPIIDRVDKIQPFIFWFLHCALRSLRRRHHHSLPLFITAQHRQNRRVFFSRNRNVLSP